MNSNIVKSFLMFFLLENGIDVGSHKEALKTFGYNDNQTALIKCEDASKLLGKNPNYASISIKPGTVIATNFARVMVTLAEDSLNGGPSRISIGKQKDGSVVAEYIDNVKNTAALSSYNPSNGKMKTAYWAEGAETPSAYKISENVPAGTDKRREPNGEFSEVLIAALLPAALEEEEFRTNFEILMENLKILLEGKKLTKTATSSAIKKINDSAAICSDNLFARLVFPELASHIFIDENFCDEETREVAFFNTKAIKTNPLTEELFGHFTLIKVDNGSSEEDKKEDDIYTAYVIGGKEYEGNPYMVTLDLTTTVVPEFVIVSAQHIFASTNSKHKIRNLWFRGSAGTGKSSAVKQLAAMLGLPYYSFPFSGDTDWCDMGGPIIPTLNDKSDKITYTYEESPIVKAFKYGGVIDMAEINTANAGVVVRLNGIMEPDGILVLPTGEIIHRHPNTVVCFTTNISYEGCRDMNAALLDRIDLVFDINNPTVEDMVERTVLQTGFSDRKLLTEMAQITTEISAEMERQGIEDGTAGLRSLISWAESTMITGDPYMSGMYTLIAKTSVNKEDRDLLSKYLNSASFANRAKARKI